MEDLHAVGGVPAVIKMLLEAGMFDGSCLTVTGKTIRRKREGPARPDARPADRTAAFAPLKATSHIQILHGSLAPEGAVAKITGKEGLRFSGPARVFDSEELTCSHEPRTRNQERRRPGDPLRRPQGRPRHAGDAHAHVRHHGRGLGQGRRADHRRPFLRRLARLHRRPHHPGSPGRRPHRARSGWRHNHYRRHNQRSGCGDSGSGAKGASSCMVDAAVSRPLGVHSPSTSAW
jgi:hypothetical protein